MEPMAKDDVPGDSGGGRQLHHQDDEWDQEVPPPAEGVGAGTGPAGPPGQEIFRSVMPLSIVQRPYQGRICAGVGPRLRDLRRTGAPRYTDREGWNQHQHDDIGGTNGQHFPCTQTPSGVRPASRTGENMIEARASPRATAAR